MVIIWETMFHFNANEKEKLYIFKFNKDDLRYPSAIVLIYLI